jgi:hypothetical protein
MNNTFSATIDTDQGIAQGGILGPLLFSIFINDLPSVFCLCSCHLYADDFQIYLSMPATSSDNYIDRFNADLARIFQWS